MPEPKSHRSTAGRWRRWLIGEWSWSRPLKSAGFVYVFLLVFAVSCADRLIFVPPAASYGEDHPTLNLLEDPDDPDARIATLWYPPPSDQAPVLLWTHGNAEDLGTVDPLLQLFTEQKIGVLAVDYPGYGLSSGRPNEAGCYHSIEAAFENLTKTQGITPDRIVLVGQSVGSGPATWLAEREPEIRGLVLISPLLSIYRVALKAPLFPGDRFPNIKRIRHISCPLLVFHGDRDEVIPFSHGEKLFSLHPGPEKAFVPLPDTGHNDLWALQFETVLTGISDFALLKKLPDSSVN